MSPVSRFRPAPLAAGIGCLLMTLLSSAAAGGERGIYDAAMQRAGAEYRTARLKCDVLDNDAMHLCLTEAKAADTRISAAAEARFQRTPKATARAHIAIADADLAVARARCSSVPAPDRTACRTDAEEIHVDAFVRARSNLHRDEKQAQTERAPRSAAGPCGGPPNRPQTGCSGANHGRPTTR
ncbi:MAG: hypothetical protein KIT73_06415 [Burkholderiales bacterium]|nr:hypothetical protein [Burkholderiales bacterium]